MALINSSGAAAEAWTVVPDGDQIRAGEKVIVSPERLTAEGDALFNSGSKIGVVFASDAKIEDFAPFYGRLALIGFRFNNMKDGRPFTLARILRTRFGFKGELRAIGELIPDQVPFLVRCGFNSFELPDGFDVDAMKRLLANYTHLYQRPVDDGRDIISLRVGGRT